MMRLQNLSGALVACFVVLGVAGLAGASYLEPFSWDFSGGTGTLPTLRQQFERLRRECRAGDQPPRKPVLCLLGNQDHCGKHVRLGIGPSDECLLHGQLEFHHVGLDVEPER